MAGPVFKFENSVDRMIDGDFSFDVILRKGDECKGLAEKMTRLNSVMSERVREMSDLAAQLNKGLSEAQMEIEDAAAAGQRLKETAELSRRLREVLDEFVVGRETSR